LHPDRVKLTGALFSAMFNLTKFQLFEGRDAVTVKQELNLQGITQWDRYAQAEYARLASEEEANAAAQVTAGGGGGGGLNEAAIDVAGGSATPFPLDDGEDEGLASRPLGALSSTVTRRSYPAAALAAGHARAPACGGGTLGRALAPSVCGFFASR